MATGVLRLWLRAYYDYGYGRTMTMATGVLRLRLRANVRAYYVNFFTAYTVHRFGKAQNSCEYVQQLMRPTVVPGVDCDVTV